MGIIIPFIGKQTQRSWGTSDSSNRNTELHCENKGCLCKIEPVETAQYCSKCSRIICISCYVELDEICERCIERTNIQQYVDSVNFAISQKLESIYVY